MLLGGSSPTTCWAEMSSPSPSEGCSQASDLRSCVGIPGESFRNWPWPESESPGLKTNADAALAKCVRMRYMFPEIWNDFGDFGAREPDNAHDSESVGLRDGGAAAAGAPQHRFGASRPSGKAAPQRVDSCTEGRRPSQTCARI